MANLIGIYIFLIFNFGFIIYVIRNFTTVRSDEIHVITGRKMQIYDGEGRYIFLPFTVKRRILSKAIISLEVNLSISDRLNNPINLHYKGRVMITNAKLAAERLSKTSKDGIEIEANEVITLSLKSAMRNLSHDDLNKQFTKISDEIFESSKKELDNIGLELSQFFITVN